MDATKLMCPTLSVVLVKTIKALCEINIKYDSKLEITGSLHVRSDGQKVLTCVLDEETVKGQHDAARIAELAARLSMAAATFPFTHLQMTPANHQQQVAEALFSSIQGDIHLINTAGMGSGMGAAAACVMPSGQQLSNLMDNGGGQTLNTSHLAAFHQKLSPVDHGGHHGSGEENMTKQSPSSSAAHRHQEETKQAMAVLRQQQQCGGEDAQPQHHHSSSSSSRKQRHLNTADVNKTHTMQNRLGINSSSCFGSPVGGRLGDDHGGGGSSFDNGILSPTLYGSMQNHIKLPDMQTLAHSLPKYPCGGVGAKKGSTGTPSVHDSPSSGVITTTKNEQVCDSVVSYASSVSVPSPSCSPRSGGNNATNVGGPGGNVNLDPMMSINIEVQSELDTDGVLVQRKRFQCMFCGIFLSTKCYLKNHVNAMHTRARVYPCELCERYFYSAGALRIHKLRNHWLGAKKHVCLQCGETFLLPIELRKHIVKKHYGRGGLGSGDGVLHDGGVGGGVDHRDLLMDVDDLKLEDGEIPMPHLRAEDVDFRASGVGHQTHRRRGSTAPSTVSLMSQSTKLNDDGSSSHRRLSVDQRTPPTLDLVGGGGRHILTE